MPSNDDDDKNESDSKVGTKLHLIGSVTLVQYAGIISEFVLFYVGLSSVSLVGLLYVAVSIFSATYREATAAYLWRVVLVFATIFAILTYFMQLGLFETLFTVDSRDRFMVQWAGFVRQTSCSNNTIQQRGIVGFMENTMPRQVFEHLAVVASAALQGYAESYLKEHVDAIYNNANSENDAITLRGIAEASKRPLEVENDTDGDITALASSSASPLPPSSPLLDKARESKRLQRTDGNSRLSSAVEAVEGLLPYHHKRRITTTEKAQKHADDWSDDVQLIEESLNFLFNDSDSTPILKSIEFSLEHNVMEAYIRVAQKSYGFASLECAMLALILAAYDRASAPSLVYLAILGFAISFPRKVVDDWWQYMVLTIMLTVVVQSAFIVFSPMVQCVTSVSGAECSITALSASTSSDAIFQWLSIVFQRPGVLTADLLAFIFASQHLNQLYTSEPNFYVLKPACAFISRDFDLGMKLERLTKRLGYSDFMDPGVRKRSIVGSCTRCSFSSVS